MKKIILTSVLLTGSLYSFAQNFSYDWHSVNTQLEEHASVDSKVYNDTLYVLSHFGGTSIDANPGAAVDLVVSNDQNNPSLIHYVTTYTLDGTYISSKKLIETAISYTFIDDFEIDRNGRLILIGYSTVDLSVYDLDFNPSAVTTGSYALSANGSITFIAFYENAGDYVGHIEYESNGTGNLRLNDASVTDQNDLIVTGNLNGTIDLDFTAGIDSHTSAGDDDAALLKIDLDNSSYSWGKHYGSANYSEGVLVETRNNRIAILGYFEDAELDLDPSGVEFTINNSTGYYNLYIALFDLNGGFVNGIGLGGNSDDLDLYGLSMDNDDNVYINGMMYQGNTLDLNPSVGTALVPNTNDYNLFLAKYNINLGLAWSRYLLSDEYIGFSADFERSSIFTNNSFVALGIGAGSGPLILSDGIGTDTLTNASSYELFVGAFNRFTGELLNHTSIVGDDAAQSYADVDHLTSDDYNNVYLTGYFQETIDFNQFDAAVDFDTSFMDSPNNYEYSPYTMKLNWTSAAGQEELTTDVSATAYPNPSTGIVNLEATTEIESVKVFQANGNLVEIMAQINGTSGKIDLSPLTRGMYWISIQTTSGIVTKTIVKS